MFLTSDAWHQEAIDERLFDDFCGHDSPSEPRSAPGRRDHGAGVPGRPALPFVSPSRGYGLVEFDTTGVSTTQQLVVTEDGGVNWQAATSTPLPSWASTLEFTDSYDGYAWGSKGLDVTHDGGQQWELSLSLATASRSRRPSEAASGRSHHRTNWKPAATEGIPGGRGCPTTAVQSGGPQPGEFRVAYMLGCSQVTQNGSQPGELARTEDGGQTWQILPLPQGCAGGQSDLVALSAGDLSLVQFSQPATDMSSKWVYRSDDGGAHWILMASENIGNPKEGTGHIFSTGDFGPLDVVASEPNRAWLAEDRGGLLVTTDGGMTWQFAYSDPNVDAFGSPSRLVS